MKDRLFDRYVTAGFIATFVVAALSGLEKPGPITKQAEVLHKNRVAVMPKPQDSSPTFTLIPGKV